MGTILNRAQVWRSERMEILRYRRPVLKACFGIGAEVANVDREIADLLAGTAQPPLTVHHWTRHRRELAEAREKSGRDPLTGGRSSV